MFSDNINGSKYKYCILPEVELSREIIALTANAADPDNHLTLITQGTF